jgi:TRAP-type mannitol/chloroaromatic compound transport system permease small subunit
MRIEKAHQSHINLAKAIFLLWPTVFIAYLLIQLLNQQYVLLQDKSIQHTTFYAVGTLIGTILFLIPIRSYIYFIGWAITYWLGLKSIVFFGQSEFDIFFREVTFKVCSSVF